MCSSFNFNADVCEMTVPVRTDYRCAGSVFLDLSRVFSANVGSAQEHETLGSYTSQKVCVLFVLSEELQLFLNLSVIPLACGNLRFIFVVRDVLT